MFLFFKRKKYLSLSLSPPNQIPAQIQINHTQFLSNKSLHKYGQGSDKTFLTDEEKTEKR